jgi:hypothetical protein
MDKAQVQKSPSSSTGKQNTQGNKTHASKNSGLLNETPISSPFHSFNATNAYTPAHFAHLQHTLGNQVVGRIIQAKLTVSKPDDKYEREADQVADKVMRMPSPAKPGDEDPTQNKPLSGQATPMVSRMPEKIADEKQPPVQAKQDKESKPDEDIPGVNKSVLQRMSAASAQQDQQDKSKETASPVIHRKPEEDKAVQAKALSTALPQVSRMPSMAIESIHRAIQMPGSLSGVDKRPEEAKPDSVQRKKARYQLHDDHDEEKKPVQPKSVHTPTPHVSPSIAANINALNNRGSPLPRSTRAFFEPRFGVDFSQIKVHTDGHAAETAQSINAKAFTFGPNIAFGSGQFAPESDEGRKLIAHELTHTIQQGQAVQRSPQLTTADTPPVVQRLSLSDLNPLEYLKKEALAFISKHAAAIPGFTMLTVILGKNPLTGAAVDRSPGNILKGAIEMIPGGSVITDALNNHGVFEKVSIWASQQFNILKDIGSTIWQDIKNFISKFSIEDLGNLGAVWDRAQHIVTAPIAQIKSFAIGLKNGIVTLVKDAILKPIAAFAKANIPNGYDLLCAVMGKDPISGEPVKQSAENLIAPFMKLIGQEEVWENMKKAGAVGRAWAWFQSALGTVKGFVQQIPTLFINAFKSLEIADIVLIPRAFAKLVSVFGGFAGQFIKWAGNAVWNLLEIIVESLGKKGLLGYIKKTGAALKSILKNPLPFVGHLVKAAINGFKNFADNFGKHLKAGLIDWLTGSLTGVYIPKELSLSELGKFALSVLGITWAQIRGKIVKALGPTGETIMKGLETGFDIVVALVKGGPAAAWEMIKEKLSDLKDTVVNGIIGFVTETVVKKAVPKLIAMFIPGAGFISALISIYDTIMVFVEKLSKIGQVVFAFIDSIVTIAAGNITAAANRVENVLGGLVSLAISFLAGFAGGGKVADKLKEVMEKVRGAIDKAQDAIINPVVAKAKAWFAKLFGSKEKKPEQEKGGASTVKEGFSMGQASHTLTATVSGDDINITMASMTDIAIGIQLATAIDQIENDKEKDDKGHTVKREPSQKAAILLDINAAKKRVDNLRKEYVDANRPQSFEKFIKPKLAAIIGDLNRLAKKKPEITSLKPLISLGRPRYIPKNWDIRKKLYDSVGNWKGKSKSMRDTHLSALSLKLFEIWKLKNDTTKPGNYAKAEAQWINMQNVREIPSVKKAPSFANYDHTRDFSNLKYETDHNPSLGMTWNTAEKNQGDDKRKNSLLGNGISKLQVITEEENQERAKDKSINPDFERDVGTEFESAVAHSPKGSMTIDGKSFDEKP